MRLRSAALRIGLLLAAAQGASAAVTVNCTATAGPIAFPTYNPLNATADAITGPIKVTCSGSGTGSTNVTVGVTLSAGLSGNFANRTMLSGTNVLYYNIYWSTTYSQVMGDGTGGSFAGTAGPFTVTAGGTNYATGTMYGLVPARQNAAPGTYSDTIVVTVTY
jgi:spore coat protein U-like protein